MIKPSKYDASSAYLLLNVGKGLLSGTVNPSVWARDPLPIELSPSQCNKYDVSPAPESQLSASELYWATSPILSGHSALFTYIWVSVSPPVLVYFSFSVPLLPFKQSFLLILGNFLLVRAGITLNIHFLFPPFIYIFFKLLQYVSLVPLKDFLLILTTRVADYNSYHISFFLFQTLSSLDLFTKYHTNTVHWNFFIFFFKWST